MLFVVFHKRATIRIMMAILGVLILLVGILTFVVPAARAVQGSTIQQDESSSQGEENYIKWIDFNVPYSALKKAMDLDIKSHQEHAEEPYDWIKILAYLASKYGNKFSLYKGKDIDELVGRLDKGETMEQITEKMQYYSHYIECYTAVLGGFLGEYAIQTPDETEGLKWENRYGLRAFSPLAKNYSFSHFDDFGNGRSYGYKRKHLGHDLMASIGTPIIAVETGIVEEMGWNRYGGWRVGIRSLDGRRYYYYAHMRQKHPYHLELQVGGQVMAGAVIGYVGRTGYSTKEGANNVTQNHLHFGLEIIFHPSQKDGYNQIWIDLYAITKLLQENRSQALKNEETKDYNRIYDFHIEDQPSWSLPPEAAVSESEGREPSSEGS